MDEKRGVECFCGDYLTFIKSDISRWDKVLILLNLKKKVTDMSLNNKQANVHVYKNIYTKNKQYKYVAGLEACTEILLRQDWKFLLPCCTETWKSCWNIHESWSASLATQSQQGERVWCWQKAFRLTVVFVNHRERFGSTGNGGNIRQFQ